jgi:hypothetical protein
VSDTPAPVRLYRFADLCAANIVKNWPQLRRLQDNQNFPRGFLLSPHARCWDASEVEAWLASRRAASARAPQHQAA